MILYLGFFIAYPLIWSRYLIKEMLCLMCFYLILQIVSLHPFLCCVLLTFEIFNLLCSFSLFLHLCKLQSKHWQIIASYSALFYLVQFQELLGQTIQYAHALMTCLNFLAFAYNFFSSFWRSFVSTHLILQVKICNILHLDFTKSLWW